MSQEQSEGGRKIIGQPNAVKFATWTPDNIERVISLYRDGIGCKTIAQRVFGDRGFNTKVKRILRKNGIEIRAVAATQDGATKARRYLKRRIRRRLVASNINEMELELFAPAIKASREAVKIEKKDKANRDRLRKKADEDADAIAHGYKSAYHKRYATDPAFKAVTLYKRRFQKIALGVGHGSTRMIKMLGCSREGLRRWIESQFEEWMTWENNGPVRKGYWQIDHIVPCSWFDQLDEDQAAICWHHHNLRPICAVHNNARRNNAWGFGKLELDLLSSLPDSPIKDALIAKALEVTRCANRKTAA
jgi:hypothetical protein